MANETQVVARPIVTLKPPANNSEPAEAVYSDFVAGDSAEKSEIIRDSERFKLLGKHIRNNLNAADQDVALKGILDVYMLEYGSSVKDPNFIRKFLERLEFTTTNSDFGTIESTLKSHLSQKRSTEGQSAMTEYFGDTNANPPVAVTGNLFNDLASMDPKRRAKAEAALDYFMSLPPDQQAAFMTNLGQRMGELISEGQVQGSDAQKWMNNALAFVKNVIREKDLPKGVLIGFFSGLAKRYESSNPELFQTTADGQKKFRASNVNIEKVFQLMNQEFTVDLGGGDQTDPTKAYFDMDALETVRRTGSVLMGKELEYQKPDGSWRSVLGDDLDEFDIDADSQIDASTIKDEVLPAAWTSATNRKAKLAALHSKVTTDSSLTPDEKKNILNNLQNQMDALDEIIEKVQELAGKALEYLVNAFREAFR